MGLLKDCQDLGSVGKSWLLRRPLPATKFYIFGTGRCGSTLLMGLLNCHSHISCDPELLSAYSRVPQAALLKRVYHCPTSVYGFKLLLYHLSEVHGMAAPGRFLQWLHTLGFKVIYLRRQNRLHHAVSLVVSAKRRVLHEPQSSQPGDSCPITIEPTDVLQTMAKFEANYRCETELLRTIPHLSLVYEEHLGVAQQHQTTADLVFDHLGLTTEPVIANLRKIMPLDLRQRILNYDEVIAAIAQSQYAQLLTEC